MQEKIKSIGIDIGTSTTQLIFSRLTIENLSNSYSVPRISIVDKEVIYRSDIYFTPLRSNTEIDAEAVKKIIEGEYKKAGFSPKDLSTGAVIITGDTARKTNANEVLASLSEMAGDFVVATAGPDLESVLSARGAGTDFMSKEEACTVANVDIGGGTSNIAVYAKGQLIATSCLDIGGRLIKVKNGRISYIYGKIKELAEKNGISISENDAADASKLQKICRLMACEIAKALNLTARDEGHRKFYTNDGKAISSDIKIDAITYSGGVADCIYGENGGDVFKYGDVGVLLGEAIKENEALAGVRRLQSKETIRATVVGAGTHTTEVSGSTVSFIESELPIKNLPVLRVAEDAERNFQDVERRIREGLKVFYVNGKLENTAIGMSGYTWRTFNDIQKLAEAIIAGSAEIVEKGYPLIIILENDIAKVLGNSIKLRLGMEKPVICLDGIHTNDGDYIDIGEPVVQGNAVPIITKTLIFNT